MQRGRVSKLGLVAATLIGVWGCRMVGADGPVPRALATSRQLSLQGVAAMEREDWPEAERILAQAIRACPADVDARRYYAQVLWQRGLREKAVIQVEEANRLGKEDPALYVLVAQMRLAMGQEQLARQSADRAIDLDPNLAEAWKVRAKIAQQKGQCEQALADYHRALGLAPEDREVKLAIAELYRRLNQPRRALAVLHSLTDSYSPGEEPAQVFRLEGMAYMALGRYEEAADSFSAAARAGGTAEDWYCLAEAQWRAGRFGGAAAAAQEALAIDPYHPASRELLDRLRVASGPEATLER